MTKIFILILFVKAGYAGGSTTAEFSSEQACLAALELAVQYFEGSWGTGARGVCVEKGEPS